MPELADLEKEEQYEHAVVYVPLLFMMSMGIWLISLYADQIDNLTGDGVHAACIKEGNHDVVEEDHSYGLTTKVHLYVLVQGMWLVVQAPLLYALVLRWDMDLVSSCKRGCVWCSIAAVNLGFYIWCLVEVDHMERHFCGEMGFQTTLFCILCSVVYGLLFLKWCQSCCPGPDCPCRISSRVLLVLYWICMAGMWAFVFVDVALPEIKRHFDTQATCQVTHMLGRPDPFYWWNEVVNASYVCCDPWNPDDCQQTDERYCFTASYTVRIYAHNGKTTPIATVKRDRKCDVCKHFTCWADNLQMMDSFLRVQGDPMFVGYQAHCWYNSLSPEDFHWDMNLTTSRWVLFFIPNLFLVLLTSIPIIAAKVVAARRKGTLHKQSEVTTTAVVAVSEHTTGNIQQQEERQETHNTQQDKEPRCLFERAVLAFPETGPPLP
eukprot:Hpha_TRINITY_DN15985_c2_g2::TRINITY_DN15985_c2_g2_i3::g.72570::m.72570